ncbi:MAG TPA: hypothetical protein VM051_12275 [Usitatibacter sp.]|nr:hypothetical protein [Usitatibacter sp.]
MTDNVFAPPRANLETRVGPDGLWEMSFKEVRKLYLASVNIRALGVLYGLGAVGAIAAGGILLFTPSKGDDAQSMGIALAIVIVALGMIHVAATVSSYSRPTWGRWLGVLLCGLSLLSIPFGTIIGILGLVAYAQGGRLFGADRLLHKDVAAVYKLRKKDKE